MRRIDKPGIGRGDERERARLVRAYDAARTAGDADAMAGAALELAAQQAWGAVPRRLPAFLHEAYQLASGARRAQLAVAIARVWAYSGDAARASSFAAEALADAERRDDSVALAAALDASLLARWGPDDLDDRLRLTARLEDAVAHVTDIDARMSAHLWRLTTALETLDQPTALRQLRELDALAAETGSSRVVFFAASRRAMHALVVDDVPAARHAAAEAIAAGWDAGEADAYAIERSLTAAIARHAGDVDTLAAEASLFEDYGVHEGFTSVVAEAAMLWDAAGNHDRARSLLLQVATPAAARTPFASIRRDAEWMHTIAALTEVAANLRVEPLCEAALTLLEPYAGRGIVNGGAVGFDGVVDDYVAKALSALGRREESRRWAATAAGAYARIGAVWWARRTIAPPPSRTTAPLRFHLRPGTTGIWWVGRDDAPVAVRESKGLRYLRVLLANPGVDVPVAQLAEAVAGHDGSRVPRQAGLEVVDRQALVAYRARLQDIDGELDQATNWSDAGRVATLTAERDALLSEIRGATAAGGRLRTTGSTEERARVAVRKAIAGALARVQDVDGELGRLLIDTVRTGALCRFEPDPHRSVAWVLEEPGDDKSPNRLEAAAPRVYG